MQAPTSKIFMVTSHGGDKAGSTHAGSIAWRSPTTCSQAEPFFDSGIDGSTGAVDADVRVRGSLVRPLIGGSVALSRGEVHLSPDMAPMGGGMRRGAEPRHALAAESLALARKRDALAADHHEAPVADRRDGPHEPAARPAPRPVHGGAETAAGAAA